MLNQLKTVLLLPIDGVAVLADRLVRRAAVLEARTARRRFRQAGSDVMIGPNCVFEPASNISVGRRVYIGPSCHFLTTNAQIVIGNGVMLAPQVAVVTGNHNIAATGNWMIDTANKRPSDDEDVVIEDDVWIGFRATILKGVRIGSGAVVGAGAVVTRDVQKNHVVGGVPARTLFCRR